MPNFFIDRPNFAWVLAIFILIAGLLAVRALPISRYPELAPPQILIEAKYPGASAATVQDSVVSIIEEELNGAKGLVYYESTTSSAGMGEISISFAPGTNADLAQIDVQNRLSKAEARLPKAVTDLGLQVQQMKAGVLMSYTLTFKGDDSGKNQVRLADYAVRYINNELRRVPGVGRLMYYGAQPAMRIWLDPQKLLGYGLSIEQVNAAIAEQNVRVAAGTFGSRPANSEQEITATITVDGTLATPQEFANIILRANYDGSTVALGDVARIEIDRQDYYFEMPVDGKQGVGGDIYLAPGANALETARAVRARLDELAPNFPHDIEHAVPFDTSRFSELAIKKVVITLIEAVVLVFLVMLLFLQNLRYTLIPTVVVPVCLAGTLAVIYVLGFSINMMTMFGMVLAIGILVDDAIVVVENVERIMATEGLNPREATIKAMGQVSGAIVGITLALSSVFLPLAFMSGSVGVIYQQFSLSLVVSILFSGLLALSLTPALCATWLKPVPEDHGTGKGGFFGWFNRAFSALSHRFVLLTSSLVRRTGRYMAIYAALVGVLVIAYSNLPEAFVPMEDQGYYFVDVQLPPGATHTRTQAVIDELQAYWDSRDAIESTMAIMGFSFSGFGQNAAVGFPMLKDWSEREHSTSEEVTAFNAHFASLSDGRVMAFDPPPVSGLGYAGGFALRLQDRGGLGREALLAARNQLLAAANESPVIAYAIMEGLEDAPQLHLDIDREKAEVFGVEFAAINTAVSTAYGSTFINDFTNMGRQQRVVVQADVADRMTPESILALHIPGAHDAQVPLSSFATIEWQVGPVQLSRYNGYPAIKISGDAAPGYSSGQAIAEMERLIAELPAGIAYEWTGLSRQEKVASDQASMLITLSLLVVFLLLVALYESWAIPLSVMLIVPIGAIGAVMAVTILGMPSDIYFKVGLTTIIGLSAKNAILIVEFAKNELAAGRSLIDSAVLAARLRFRPIIMTSLAFICGVIPLAIATGAGSASQRAIGTSVIGGMLTATTLGVIFVPLFFVWVLSWIKRYRQSTSAEFEPVPGLASNTADE